MNLLYGGVLAPVATTGRSDLSLILRDRRPGPELHRADARRPAAPEHGDEAGCAAAPARAGRPARPLPTGSACSTPTSAAIPNGRRLADDVVDIDLRAFGQGYGAFLNGAFGLPEPEPEQPARRRRRRERRRRSRTPSRTSRRRTRATRFPRRPERQEWAGEATWPAPLPPPAKGDFSVRRKRLILGAAAAVLTALAALLGGALRGSLARDPRARDRGARRLRGSRHRRRRRRRRPRAR